MPSSFVVLPEADSDDDAAYNGTDCAYEWKSLKAPTLKGFLLRLVLWITHTPLWGPFYTLFAKRSGVFKVCVSYRPGSLVICMPNLSRTIVQHL